MQDDLLMDKSKAQRQQQQQQQQQLLPQDPSSDAPSTSVAPATSRSEDSAVTSLILAAPAPIKEKMQMESPVLPGLSFQQEPAAASLSPSFGSAWSTGTANAIEDSFFPGITSVNGTMLFQNFPHPVNPVFGGTFSPQIGIAHQTPQPQPQAQQQRRSPVSPSQAPFAPRNAYNHQPIMTNKPSSSAASSSSWNNHQNTAWSTPSNPWGGLQPGRDPRRAVGIGVGVGVGVPSPLNPISPLKKPFSSNVIAPPKFPRAAPLTPKSWLEDNAFRADNGNNLLPFQDRNRPYDTFNLHSLESSLMDMIRTDHEPLKGKHYPPSGPPMSFADIMWRNHFAGRMGINFHHPGTDNIMALNNEITASFRRFGPLVVDWPHKAESKSYFPPKGYAFLLFQEESSVQALIDACLEEDGKLYLCVSSPTIKDKPVQIRPWNLSDSDFVMDGSQPLDPRKTIFVGGVPRPLRAVELAMIMDRLYGGVCYAGIDTDPELKYPKGAGRVAFSNQQSYIAAISARFVQLQHNDIDKRVEVKPYVLDDQMCDECQGTRCAGKFAPFFCANVTCLQYYCEYCWASIHSRAGREFHKPLVKEGGDRPRHVPFRWS
uniref:Cytoplasmic polyadenylation element-binding protein 3 isoform X8 n=1 Tax=Geotrypetes seraphini TaxID=260995 RepID=A0A6P8QT59_GEOSA|nr:cytoplasmic polyadenylation element-binding protein 3 isoform X8 [Geotrypetes seraphini]